MSEGDSNFNVGGTGGAIFDESVAAKARQETNFANTEYRPPPGVPQWKQPEFDDDDDDVLGSKHAPGGSASKLKSHWLMSRFSPDPVQQCMILAKLFYLFFFSAFGSLFPLMAVYFKQLGMDAAQCGFIIGIRPLVEFLATPFWNKIARRFQKGKVMLIIALISWIFFTVPIGFIRPPVVSCKYYNGTQYLLKLPNVDSERSKREVEYRNIEGKVPTSADLSHDSSRRQRRVKREAYDHQWAPGYVIGTSPQSILFTYNYDAKRHNDWISPAFSNQVFERAGVHKVFFLIFLLVIIGEFFSSPAIALADSAVITFLGEKNEDKYNGLRVFGSMGWGVTMFIMGIVLDHSRYYSSKCDVNDAQRNYHACFYVFAILMLLALVFGSQIPFTYQQSDTTTVGQDAIGEPKSNTPMVNQPQQNVQNVNFLQKTKVFAQQLQSMPEYVSVFKAMANLRLLTFMILAWIMGIGMGLIFTFLFWHLQDYGGGPTLFGIASVINHLSEMIAYAYALKIIKKFGHIKVLGAGLLCNLARFLYISYIQWPWLVLPFEMIQGITHATVWAACCSFIVHNTSPELRPSAQGVLKGVHHGLGKFAGSVVGGILIKTKGTAVIFRIYGILCGVFFVLFCGVNFAAMKEGSSDGSDEDQVDQVEHLTPHGVPTSARKPEAFVTEDDQTQQTYQPQENNNITTNPFVEEGVAYTETGSRIDPQQTYYGGGHSQAHSGYSSSGLGLQ